MSNRSRDSGDCQSAFLSFIRRFYLSAWKRSICRSWKIENLYRCIGIASGRVKGGPPQELIVDFRDWVTQRLRIATLARGAPPLSVVPLGITARPGRPGMRWAYFYLQQTNSFFVLNLSERATSRLENHIGKLLQLRATEGAVRIPVPINKAFRGGRVVVKYRPLPGVAELPCVRTHHLDDVRIGLLSPYAVVQAPVATEDGIRPEVGYLAVLDLTTTNIDERGNLISIRGTTLSRNFYRAMPDANCLVVLLFLGQRYVGGYALSRIRCKCGKSPELYLPNTLYVDLPAEEVAKELESAPSYLLKYYEEGLRAETAQGGMSRRERLIQAYKSLGRTLVKVPNPKLTKCGKLTERWLATTRSSTT